MADRIDVNRLLLEGVRNSATKGNDNEKTKQGSLTLEYPDDVPHLLQLTGEASSIG